jgi:hypothetical protein
VAGGGNECVLLKFCPFFRPVLHFSFIFNNLIKLLDGISVPVDRISVPVDRISVPVDRISVPVDRISVSVTYDNVQVIKVKG